MTIETAQTDETARLLALKAAIIRVIIAVFDGLPSTVEPTNAPREPKKELSQDEFNGWMQGIALLKQESEQRARNAAKGCNHDY